MCVLFLLLLLTVTSALCQDVKVAGQRSSSQDAIKVVISEGCVAQADAADGTTGGKELSLSPGSPLVLTHQIRLVPSGSGSGPGSCECDGDLSALRARVERLEREVSALREKCGDPENPGCCSSSESKGPGCSISPDSRLCPNDCSDQGRCVDGHCQCFPGFSGADCAKEECPVDCGERGRCVDGECQCDPGFSGPDCSQSSCPGNCNNRGRCVDGKCVCESGFGGENCADKTCPGNCNNRGRCVNGKCVCESGFGGENCADKTCPGNCNNRGRCVDGKCQCNPGFGGENCADRTCPGNCNNRGRCVNGKCQCSPGFSGPDCSRATCPGNCNNRGRCVDGKCVCNPGFGGENCADKTCPGNCNNRGRCVNGKCVCESGFGGADCGSKMCPDNCGGRGVCVDGKCVCDSGFGGENCADKTCPGNCNNRGRCVDGKCVCDSGFKGVECAEKACPNECSGRGKCVDGRCVCEVGFTGTDCSAKGCPGNCNNRGRCVKGKCVCRRGFSGADCGQCQEGLTGPNCDTVMSAVEELHTKDLTQSSVTVVWTQPPVQYESYLLSFSSQKDGSEVQAEVPGSDSSFTQSGLAPGQSYSVTVTGRTGQSKGAPNTARFNTLPSGPSNLRVVKTSTSSAVVQWEPSLSDVDRYRLTVSRSDGAGRSQELTFDPTTSSAHITQLEAGLRYDITLVAEKGRSQSEPVTTHATPGSANVLVAALTVGPFTEDTLNLTTENNNKNIKKPITPRPGKVPKPNITKVIQRIQVAPSTGAKRDSYPTVESGTNLETKKEMNLKEGDTGTGLTTPEPKRTCLNRVKVTHGRLIQKDKTSGCAESETEGTAERSPGAQGSEQEPPQSKDLEIPEDRSLAQPYPLQRLLTDTFNKLNVTTFSIHVSEPSNIDSEAEIVAEQIIKGLKPISTIKKSIRYLDTPRITSLSSERSQIKTASPTSATQISVLTNVETNIKDDDNSRNENLDDPRPEDDMESPREGSTSTYRRTQPGRTIVRRPRPNLWHLRNKTGLITRDSDASLPSSSKMTSSSTNTPFPVTQKPSLNSDSGTDLNNEGESEGAKPKQAMAPGLERPSVPHVRPFLNKTHPSSRFYRRPIRLLNNKTQTAEPQGAGVDGMPTTVPPGETGPNMPKDRFPLARASFNRSRLVYPRRPNQFTGPFQNRTRLFFRPPQRGPIRKNLTAESAPNGHQNRDSNSAMQDKAEGGAGAKTEVSVSENPNLNVDNVPKFVENAKDRLHISKLEEGKMGVVNTGPQIPSDRHEPGNEESKIMSQTNESEQLKGLNTGETDLGKDSIDIFTQRIEIENDEMDKNVKKEENDPNISQDELKNLENRGSSNIEEEDLSLHSDDDKAAKDIGQNNPEQQQTQNSGPDSQGTNNSGSPLFRRRFRPGVQPMGRVPLRFQGKIAARDGVSGSDQPERSYQDVAATRTQEETESQEGHGIKNVLKVKLDSPKDGGASTGQRGLPSRTVIRRLRPNLDQSERIIKKVITTRRQKDPDSTEGHGIQNENEKLDSPKEGGASTDERRGPSQTVIPRLRPNLDPPERSIKNVVTTRGEEDPDSVEGHGSQNEKTDSPKEGGASTDQRRGPSQAVIRQLRPNLDQPERSIKNAVTTRGEEDPDPVEGHGIQNENEKLDSPKEGGAATNQRREPSRTVIRRLRPNLQQFRNKTAPAVRRGNVSLPLSSKMHPASTDTPELSEEKPSLSDGKGEKQSLSDNGQGDDKALRKMKESEDPRGPQRLDEVFSESDYKLTVLGKGSGVLSRLSKLVISTGPEPPTDLVFDHVTEDSVTVSWTKPKSKVSGFKVTYTHTEEGEPYSVSLDQGNSSIDLTRLSPGSTYEVSILSVLGLDESDPISGTFHTLPDSPTDLRAVNVTDTGALLLWRPALAAVEKYTIVYGSGTAAEWSVCCVQTPEVRVTVSGNTAEEQLNGLQPSTTYTVTISSELDSRKSKEASTSFTTTGSDGAGDLRATNVTPRTATLSWKPPSRPVTGYKLIYETEGQKKEVLVAPAVTQLNLTKLFPGAEYSVELQAQGGGGEILFTTFTTGSLRFPFPSDCSQEQLNGLRVSSLVDIFPLGRQGPALSVWCDMETDGGGWTVFQRRRDGSVDFFRSWKEYVQGFGDPSGEFWLGLEALHTLTTRGRMTLRVDLRDGQDSVFAQYSTFEVAKRNYRLTVAGYSGTAGDSMSYHNNRIFSTKDRDPASFITRCAMSYRGGWWYKNCHEANLNGLYGINSKHQGIIWTSWKGKEVSIPFTEMKMRPTDFLPNKNNYRA
ncbi:LOW QUALITY PROTEIN: tenascin-like [Boleophthalmus pectinirostris]|uniref:LOW QUALITY PROTEIN: tenascin-like n=1 Tax=Boleophthalmus pectinirostris TaxID=150288 RepID=UPI00242F1B93|nr:LOW QUALITY PROTEIN: tenascin-like [Boleophthalmus pectinirostris]